tara:strand:- start:383 stop:523 length:141 start_codon:yes stop_codon:yes gene_type:complete
MPPPVAAALSALAVAALPVTAATVALAAALHLYEQGRPECGGLRVL